MIEVVTEYPVAIDSPDHLKPWGTMRDSSVLPSFNAKLFARYDVAQLLDLGCAGGGLVESVLEDGGFAVGIEGSDYSKKRDRASWASIPGNLFTADIGHPFEVMADGDRAYFDVVTAWEVLEHLTEEGIHGLVLNVRAHLAPGGVLLASIAPREDHPWHQTVRSPGWWLDRLTSLGLELDHEATAYFDPDWVRGPLTGEVDSFCAAWRAR